MGGQKSKRVFSPDFGKFVKQECKKVFPDLSGRKIAAKLNISSAYFFDILNGKVPPPSQKIVVDIARLLQIDEALLMRLAGHQASIVQYSIPSKTWPVSQRFIQILMEVLREEGDSPIQDDMISFISLFLKSEKYEKARKEVARRICEEYKSFSDETSPEKKRCLNEVTAKLDLQVAEPKTDYSK